MEDDLVSRRSFEHRLAAAALVALQPSCSLRRPIPAAQRLREELTGLSGRLLFDAGARQSADDDFGHLVHRPSAAVLAPGSVQDIVDTVRFANRHGMPVSMRGQGHAMLGQAQAHTGVVIDSRTLASVRLVRSIRGPVIEAEAGALWGTVVEAANASELTPPVNVDPTFLSVGGTISSGGFGATTWRDGFQVDHVVAVEVVTGDGRLMACSDTVNPDLFDAVLAGMGQCAIIVKVVLALVKAPTHVFFLDLAYPDLRTASADLLFLVRDGRFDHLDVRSIARTGGGFSFIVEAAAFHGGGNIPVERDLVAGLSFTGKAARAMTYAQYVRRQSVCNACTPSPHPWLYLCLPESKFLAFAERVIATPAESAFALPRFSAWRRSASRRPLVRLPDEETVVRFQLSRNPPATADAPALLAMNRTLYERARDVGGTRLTTTAIPFSQADWVLHYGAAWQSLRDAKNRYDPNHVLAPGLCFP